MISVRHLAVSFGPTRAIDDVSFEVRPGDTYGLVGESGCGKSTLLRVLSGLNRHWSGEIEIAGRRIGPSRDKAFHRQVQMVFQDPFGSLHPRHTVDRTLAEPVMIHGLGDAEARIARVLDDVGLGPRFRFRYPHQLSGGQRQRVAIARALILDPSILLLDEPTSALDVSIQAEVLNLLARLRAEHELTLILVSHNLAVVAHLCNRLAVMQGGKIVEELTVDALRHGEPGHPYSRELLRASLGYTRSSGAA